MYGTRTLLRAGDHLRFPFSGRNSTMTALDVLTTLLDSALITLAQIRAILGI
jgi:hypothetical protein